MASGEPDSNHADRAVRAAECAGAPAGRLESPDFVGETPESLLQACVNLGDWQAWDRFVQAFNHVIVATVLRTGRSYAIIHPDLRDDLVQDVYVRLSAKKAKALRDFTPLYEGCAFSYIKVIAACVVHDHFRSKRPKDVQSDVSADDRRARDRMEMALLWWAAPAG